MNMQQKVLGPSNCSSFFKQWQCAYTGLKFAVTVYDHDQANKPAKSINQDLSLARIGKFYIFYKENYKFFASSERILHVLKDGMKVC